VENSSSNYSMNAIYGLKCQCHPEQGIRYIGQTIRGVAWRLRVHLSTARGKYKSSGAPVYNWIRKHGPENIVPVIIHQFQSPLVLDEAEVHWIRFYRKNGKAKLMNVLSGGLGGSPGPMSDETKQKIREAHLGRKVSDEGKKRMRDRMVNSNVAHGENNIKAKLTWEQVDDIRSREILPSGVRGGVAPSEAALAEEFGVTQGTIHRILLNKAWVRRSSDLSR